MGVAHSTNSILGSQQHCRMLNAGLLLAVPAHATGLAVYSAIIIQITRPNNYWFVSKRAKASLNTEAVSKHKVH